LLHLITLVAPKFHGKSVSALAQQFGGILTAATTLGFANVAAMQTGISTFCQK
jgi:hypothetical protein